MIKIAKSYKADGHLAIILGKKYTAIEGVSTIVSDQAQKFMKSSDDSDFLKLGEQFIFFVREQDDLEKMRVAGHAIRTKLSRTADTLFISGQGEKALALAEGVALSSYQFLKYFKDAEKKRYALSSVQLLGDFDKKAIGILKAPSLRSPCARR